MKNSTLYKITLYFFIFGLLWIIFSDKLLLLFYPDFVDFALGQTLKGIFFVLLASVIVFLLLKKYVSKDVSEIKEASSNQLQTVKEQLITDENKIKTLETYQHKLNAIVKSNLQAFILFDKNKNVLLYNEPAATYIKFYLSRDLEEGIYFPDMLKEELRKDFENNFSKALNGEIVKSRKKFEKDGKTEYLEFCYSFAQDNEISGVIFSTNDITAREEVVNELKKTVEIYSDLIKATPDAVAIIKKDFTVEYISPMVLKLLNFRAEDIPANVKLLDWIDESDKERMKEKIEKIITDKIHTKGNVYRVRKADGTFFYAEFNSSPIENLNGEINSFITTFRDVTERRESIIKLQQYSEELKELNASKDKFFSIVAHDLRNPLQGLLGFSSLLNDNFSDLTLEEVREYIGYIYQSSKKMHALTNNLLQWSRIKTGKVEFNPEPINIYDRVITNVALLRPNALKKNIEININVSKNIKINFDEKMFDSVIQNLLSNAIKFSYPNSNINIYSKTVDDELIEVSVQDYGTGMSEDTLNKLFSIEFSHSAPGTAQEEGTGLGLILIKDLTEKNKGQILIDSKENEGSTFKLILPKHKENANIQL